MNIFLHQKEEQKRRKFKKREDKKGEALAPCTGNGTGRIHGFRCSFPWSLSGITGAGRFYDITFLIKKNEEDRINVYMRREDLNEKSSEHEALYFFSLI